MAAPPGAGGPLPPLNLNANTSSGASADGAFTVNSIGGGGAQLRHLPWYAWASVALVAILYLKKRKG